MRRKSFLSRQNSKYNNLDERNMQIRIKIINSFNLNEEVFLKKYFCDRETLFMISRSSFKKLVRDKPDIKFISLYLSNLKNFTNLLKSISEDNNNNNTAKQNNDEKDKYFKLLRYVSEHIIYETYESKRLIMRFGDIGDRFYIILHGLVSIITPIKVNMLLTFNEYCRYIARLILFKEYELAKITIRENKHIYNIDLPEIKFIIRYIKKEIEEEYNEKDDDKTSRNYFMHVKNLKSSKNIFQQRLIFKSPKNILSREKEDNKRNLEMEKMTESENVSKVEKFMTKYLTKEEMKEFEEMKENENYLDGENEVRKITPEEYINRLKDFKIKNENAVKNFNNANKLNSLQRRKKSSQNLLFRSPVHRKSTKSESFLMRSKEKEKEEINYYENLQAIHNKNNVYIYEYQEIIQLETGKMFGDTALNNNSCKRTATIITLMDSYFGCFNREIYNSFKVSNEKNRRNMINYICHSRIFKCINFKTLEGKYLNYFAFKSSVMDEYIIKSGQISNNLIIIKSGKFEISYSGDLKDVFNLMNYYRDTFSDLGDKRYELSDCLFKKIYKLNGNFRKIQKLFGEDKDTNFGHKLFIINSSSIYGLKETEQIQDNNEYISFFDIKCTSSEGEYVCLDKRIFYRQIYGTDFKVKEETKLYIKEFVEKTVNRLIHIIYAKMYYILSRNNMKAFKNIKQMSLVNEKSNKGSNNLMHEIGLDFKYMKKFNLTDIECIIEKILNRFTEEAFDNRNLEINLYNYFENEKITTVQEKNVKRLEEEEFEFDIKKFKNEFKQTKAKGKKNYLKLFNSKKPYSKLSKQKKKIYNNGKNIKLISYDNSKNNSTIKKRMNVFSPFQPRKIKYKLNKSVFSSSIDDKKNEISPSNNKSRIVFFDKNNSISKNFSSGFSQGKTMDSFISDVGVNCNYLNYNNAFISKINYKIKKNNSMNDFQATNDKKFISLRYNNIIEHEMNQIFGGKEKYKSLYRKCFSARHSNNSKSCIFDSSKQNQEIYVDKRKEYVLKNTRSFFTRNKNFIQYKRRKKKVDKKV